MESTTPVAPLTPTPATEWKGKVTVDGVDLLLPSGNVIRLRKISPQTFLSSGLLPDPLSQIVHKAIHSKKGLPPSKVKEMSQDPKQIQSSLEMFDRVLSYVAIEPAIPMPPPCVECGEYANVDGRHLKGDDEFAHAYKEGPRTDGVLYADMVDLTDKIFIFQYSLGGVSDLEKFRAELPRGLGGLSHL